jgi:hypothetical protein
VEVPEEWLQGIETGWLESKSSRAGTADKGERLGGGNRKLLLAKKMVKVLQVGKEAPFTADTKALNGRVKGAVKRTKRFPVAMTDLTGDTVMGKACEGAPRTCRSPRKWGPGIWRVEQRCRRTPKAI